MDNYYRYGNYCHYDNRNEELVYAVPIIGSLVTIDSYVLG